MLDRGQRRGAGAPFEARDGDVVGARLGDAGGNRADADLGDEIRPTPDRRGADRGRGRGRAAVAGRPQRRGRGGPAACALRVGIAGACSLLGPRPVPLQALAPVGADEVVANRILWSALFLARLLPFGRCATASRWRPWRPAAGGDAAADRLPTPPTGRSTSSWSRAGRCWTRAWATSSGCSISVALGVDRPARAALAGQNAAVLLAMLRGPRPDPAARRGARSRPRAGRLVQHLRPRASASRSSSSSASSSSAT